MNHITIAQILAAQNNVAKALEDGQEDVAAQENFRVGQLVRDYAEQQDRDGVATVRISGMVG